MKKQLFVLGMTSVFALTGCHGIKKVEYAEFKEEVNKLEEVKVSEVKISGKLDGDKVNVKWSTDTSIVSLALDTNHSDNEKAAYIVAMGLKTPALYAAAEADGVTYYTGMGFKMKSEDGSIEWDSKGLLAKMQAKEDGKEYNLSFTWKKA